MQVTIIGTGNVGTVLGKLMLRSKHTIVEVWGRNPEHTVLLANQLEAVAVNDLQQINRQSDIYLVVVADDAIGVVARQLPITGKLVLHTAGSVPGNVLEGGGNAYGVLWPIQSLRKEMEYLPVIPFGIDGNDASTIQTIRAFAETLSPLVTVADDVKRRQLHLAAVITSNFTNYLYALAEDYCRQEQVDFKLLLPLMEETVTRAGLISPSQTQTGPAARGDEKTIQAHLTLLQHQPGLQQIYQLLSEHILASRN